MNRYALWLIPHIQFGYDASLFFESACLFPFQKRLHLVDALQKPFPLFSRHHIFSKPIKARFPHWQLQQDSQGKVSGTAGDVIGEAAGQLAGNALYWQYVLRIPYDGSTLDVTVKDWLYLIDPQNLINRTTMHKFGIKVAELTLSIQQTDAGADCTDLKRKVAEVAATQGQIL